MANVIVSSETATQVGAIFRKNGSGDSKLKSATSVSIKEITTVFNDNGQPAMYVINYENDEGFVLVSATRNYYPVLAFSEKGNFKLNENDIPLGVTEWVRGNKETIKKQAAEQNLDSLKRFREMWKMYETPNLTVKIKSTTGNGNLKSYEYETFEYYPTFNIALSESLQKWQREGTNYEHWQSSQHLTTEIYNMIMGMTMDYYPTEAFILTEYEVDSEVINPLITTKWGQHSPYYLLTPNNYPAGCVATAMAQVMRYHRWPNTYNWSIMKDDYSDSGISQESKNEVAKLMLVAGISVMMHYDSDGSSARTSDIPGALKREFGYSSNVKHSSYDFSAVVRDIRARRPVILGGMRDQILGFIPTNGHAWVCDGYTWLSSKKKTALVVINGMLDPVEVRYIPLSNWEYEYSTSYLHMNWGWDERGNGWFSPHSAAVTVEGKYYNYQYGRDMVTNIYPNK